MSYRDDQRLADITAAIEAIRSHTFDTSHAIVEATVHNELDVLAAAVTRLTQLTA